VTRPLEKEENRSSQCAITGSLSRRKKNIAPLTRGGRLDGEVVGDTVHVQWRKVEMRLARCDSGDEVGWGAPGS
jgi:hypothetical protein